MALNAGGGRYIDYGQLPCMNDKSDKFYLWFPSGHKFLASVGDKFDSHFSIVFILFVAGILTTHCYPQITI